MTVEEAKMWLFKLPPNPVERFYRGGEWIARFRRAANWPARAPEEWIASTTTVYGETTLGLSRLPDGTLLRDRLLAEQLAFLGSEHSHHRDGEPGLLIKLLEAGERLPVHLHPDDRVAREQIGYPWGKTEAWFVIHAEPGSVVWLGFRRSLAADDLAQLVRDRDSSRLLDTLFEIPVQKGQSLFVPAGTPHAIGEGIALVELQQASDLSILLEWWPFDSKFAAQWHLGLTPDGAFAAVDYTVWTEDRVREYVRSIPTTPGSHRLFPEAAEPYFRGERVIVADVVELEPAYQVLIVLDGNGVVRAPSGEEMILESGDVILAAHAAGFLSLTGSLDIVRCLPGMLPPIGQE